MINRVILTSVATGELGRAGVHLFAEDGHSLVLLGTDQNKLNGLLDSLGQAFQFIRHLKDL